MTATHPIDAWIDALEEVMDDPYKPCPCGCGNKFKYVKRDLQEHEDRFIENYKKESE